MANQNLFQSPRGKLLPQADARNVAGAPAWLLPPKHRLAQYAATGCLNDTYYADAGDQLATVLELGRDLDTRFLAQAAIHCRERGDMKDMPALLVALLAARGARELAPAFDRVIDNGRMLRSFVQIVRSGATGRKSLGTRPKTLVQQWLNRADEKTLLAAAVGTAPSLADVVRMVHPRPAQAWRAAFFAWLVGKPYDARALPPLTAAFDAWKRDRSAPLPAVPFQLLTALPLADRDWAQLALQGGWQMLRMNLNTFARHGVFALPGMTDAVAARLCDPQEIARARVFPYQLMAACRAAGAVLPARLRTALEEALDIALANVPRIAGRVVVCPDVSGSMASPVTGWRGAATSKVRCIDVAALVAAALARRNPDTVMLPFARRVVEVALERDATVMRNAEVLAGIGGGGTDCSAPLAWLNRRKVDAELVVFVSDNASWIDAARGAGATATLREWRRFKERNPQAKLACIDVTPYGTTQAPEAPDVLNVGGFSDAVFDILAAFAAGRLGAGHWVGEIESIAL
ncbi:RNA-binding protein [uncultured Massilia sp.]|uniref:vWA domain-containing protein n=1 Tax=uncultured Massilia sp. TaxID=169973 RepID=UPI0025F6AFF5|nr:RNA-binding protein [uncultured Massilia sp.]